MNHLLIFQLKNKIGKHFILGLQYSAYAVKQSLIFIRAIIPPIIQASMELLMRSL